MMSEKKKKNDFQVNRKPRNPNLCSNCGNDHFAGGKVRVNGSLFKFKAFGSGMFSLGKQIRARQCTHCGKIELFAEQANG